MTPDLKRAYKPGMRDRLLAKVAAHKAARTAKLVGVARDKAIVAAYRRAKAARLLRARRPYLFD